jgi:hypothetical protein
MQNPRIVPWNTTNPSYTYIILEKQSIPQRGRIHVELPIKLEYLDQCNNHILLQR